MPGNARGSAIETGESTNLQGGLVLHHSFSRLIEIMLATSPLRMSKLGRGEMELFMELSSMICT